MCMVSMVLDYGQRTLPENYTLDQYHDLWKMIEAAKKFDQKQGEKDCEDPEKVDFLKQIIVRLERIEKRLEEFDAKAELERVNRVLGPQPQPEIIPVIIDPTPPIGPQINPLDPFNPFGGIGGISVGHTELVGDIRVPKPTIITIGQETEKQRDRRLNAGYCPKCGSQWVEAPCADPEHRRRRYAF